MHTVHVGFGPITHHHCHFLGYIGGKEKFRQQFLEKKDFLAKKNNIFNSNVNQPLPSLRDTYAFRWLEKDWKWIMRFSAIFSPWSRFKVARGFEILRYFRQASIFDVHPWMVWSFEGLEIIIKINHKNQWEKKIYFIFQFSKNIWCEKVYGMKENAFKWEQILAQLSFHMGREKTQTPMTTTLCTGLTEKRNSITSTPPPL